MRALDAATIERIKELRQQGLSLNATAAELGVSRRSVAKHQPKQQGARRSTHKPEHQEILDVDEYADVVPIPFFPADLPVLDFSDGGFAWTKDELNEACRLARLSLFPNEGATEGIK